MELTLCLVRPSLSDDGRERAADARASCRSGAGPSHGQRHQRRRARSSRSIKTPRRLPRCSCVLPLPLSRSYRARADPALDRSQRSSSSTRRGSASTASSTGGTRPSRPWRACAAPRSAREEADVALAAQVHLLLLGNVLDRATPDRFAHRGGSPRRTTLFCASSCVLTARSTSSAAADPCARLDARRRFRDAALVVPSMADTRARPSLGDSVRPVRRSLPPRAVEARTDAVERRLAGRIGSTRMTSRRRPRFSCSVLRTLFLTS